MNASHWMASIFLVKCEVKSLFWKEGDISKLRREKNHGQKMNKQIF